MYLDGDGVTESIYEGAEWVNLAFQQGCEFAAEMIDEYELWDIVDGWYEWMNSQQ